MNRYRAKSLLDGAMRRIWPAYYSGGNEHDPRVVGKAWIRQKILRKNSHVPWPVHPSSNVVAPNRIRRGSRTPGLARGCHIDGRNGIELGANVRIGPSVKLISMNHDSTDFNRYLTADPIVIGENSWIGSSAIILPGVKIGSHTIVAAGAVVTKSFPGSDQVLAGNPARVVKKLARYGV